MKMLFLGLSAVILLAAVTPPASACFRGAGYAAADGTHYYRPYRYYRGYGLYRGYHPYLRYRAARRILR
jgi:hypothetical protein